MSWSYVKNLPMKLVILQKLSNHIEGISSFKLAKELSNERKTFIAESTIRYHLQWLEKHGCVKREGSKWKLLKTTPVLCVDKTVIVKYPIPFIMGCKYAESCKPEDNFPNCRLGEEVRKKGLLEFAISIPIEQDAT